MEDGMLWEEPTLEGRARAGVKAQESECDRDEEGWE